jgi:hypothetical protein
VSPSQQGLLHLMSAVGEGKEPSFSQRLDQGRLLSSNRPSRRVLEDSKRTIPLHPRADLCYVDDVLGRWEKNSRCAVIPLCIGSRMRGCNDGEPKLSLN